MSEERRSVEEGWVVSHLTVSEKSCGVTSETKTGAVCTECACVRARR